MRFILSGVGAAVLLAGPAYAIEIQPGLWQDAETAEIAGQVYPPEMMTSCIKPEDAKDIVKAALAHQKEMMMNDRPQECSKFDVKQDGDVMLFEMKCHDPKDGDIDVSMTMTMTVNSAAEHDKAHKVDDGRGRADKGHQRDHRIEMALGELR